MDYSDAATDGAVLVLKMDAVTFAKRLREARQRADLTQQQVADACGLTKGAVSAWEQGVTDGILAENLFCVADILRVDPRWLATGQEPTAADVVRELSGISAEQQEAVRTLIRSMKS